MDDPGEANTNASLNLIADYCSESDSEDTETNNTGNDDSDAVEHHEMVLKNNIINACAHGPISKTDSETDDPAVIRHMIIDSSKSGVMEYEVSEYRVMDTTSDTSSDDWSDSDVESVKDVEGISGGSGDEAESTNRGKPDPLKVHGELGLDDLPPIEDLAISLPSQDTTKIGTVASIVDRLVIVRSIPEAAPVDIDSILFLDNGAKTLGKVFDVFGPVSEAHYCVRFNSAQHVAERGVAAGADVFIAPRTPHTSYVFLADLMRSKGSDASWLNDLEPPPNQVDYSDDEEERTANKARKEQKQNKKEESSGETSNQTFRKTLEAKRNTRPSESSSRFGSGPSRGRNPFLATFRGNPTTFPRFSRGWPNHPLQPPPAPAGDPAPLSYTAPPTFNPIYPPQFNIAQPPPILNQFQFGLNPQLPLPPMNIPPPFRRAAPIFGSNFCGMPGPQPQWPTGTPPPPGT